jgi:HEAT repeat protein
MSEHEQMPERAIGDRGAAAAAVEAEARALVEQLEDNATRWPAWKRLEEIGAAAAPAVRDGLRHGHWQVRKWCAGFLDHHSDPESLPELIPLLHDPKSDVRLFAVHSLSCDRCKLDQNPVDYVPLLIERIERDESIRVRRMATLMLAAAKPHPRSVAAFNWILERETDRKLLQHARWGLRRCREVGLAPADGRVGPR